jgi:DNA (cytosine-5)-methyltransferase 1
MRMLAPRELFRAQGFPDDVQLRGTATSQVRLCGNSVSPVIAEAIVGANYGFSRRREAA